MFMASMSLGAVCGWAGAVMQVGWGCLVGGQGLLCLKITILANFASLYYFVLLTNPRMDGHTLLKSRFASNLNMKK